MLDFILTSNSTVLKTASSLFKQFKQIKTIFVTVFSLLFFFSFLVHQCCCNSGCFVFLFSWPFISCCVWQCSVKELKSVQ